jgi:hypothetical protein
MRFTKYNNPNKKRSHKKLSRTDADIIAAKNMFDDRSRGVDLPLSVYDRQSDIMSGKPSRNIY